MKKNLPFFTLLLLWGTTLTVSAQIAPNNRLLFTTDLNGEQEVPSVNTNARGIVTVLLSEDRTTMSVHGVFNGLSGPITGCHIHTGAAATNGPVFINFTANVTGNRLRAEIPVPAGFFPRALNDELYLNVHTAANPGGEIRGQLELMAEEIYGVVLTGSNEVPPVNTLASGVGALAYSSGNFSLRYHIVVNGLSGPITAAHIHSGATGVSGPVVTPLITGLPNVLSGNLSLLSLPVDFFQKLIQGDLYVNVHTAANPGGEIRGQLMALGPLAFEASLNGDQETPPVASAAAGAAFAYLSSNLDSVTYHVVASGLTPTAAHFHLGAAGVAGPVLVGLQPASLPNYYTAKVPANSTSVSQLINGGVYVNVHTAANPGGEIRGQMESLLKRVYAFDLCSEQEVPPNGSTAIGAAYIATDRLNSHLVYRYITNGLTGAATAAHVHDGAPGVSGPVYFGVNLPNPVGSGQFQITGVDVQKLESGNTYLNVHTAANPGGEIRGQVMRGLSCSVNVPVKEPFVGKSVIFPNPTTGETLLQLQVHESFDGQLIVTNISGQVVRQENHIFIAGDQILQMHLDKLPDGLYFVAIRSESHGIVRTSKLVKY